LFILRTVVWWSTSLPVRSRKIRLSRPARIWRSGACAPQAYAPSPEQNWVCWDRASVSTIPWDRAAVC